MEEDLVAGEAVRLAAEEVVEADLVERGRAGVGRQVAADAGVLRVRPRHHHGGVPADVGADAALEVLVAGEPRLLIGRDGVHVRRRHRGREADLRGPRPLEELHQEEPGPVAAALLHDGVEGVEPLDGLLWVDVGDLVGEAVEDHSLILAPPMPARRVSEAACGPVARVGPCLTSRSRPRRARDRLHRRCLPAKPRPRRLGLGGLRGAVRERLRGGDHEPADGAEGGLEALDGVSSGRVRVVSDSTYVVNCFRQRWWAGWRAEGWRNAKGEPVANQDLWRPLVEPRHRRAGRRRSSWNG